MRGETIHDWHLEIEQDEIKQLQLGHLYCIAAVDCCGDLVVAKHLENALPDMQIDGIVIDEEDLEGEILQYPSADPRLKDVVTDLCELQIRLSLPI